MKTYRQDAHLFSLVGWVLFSALFGGIYIYWNHSISPPLRAIELGIVGAILLVGLVSLAVYWIRAKRVWVEVHPEKGIVVSGSATIAWAALERIERIRPRFRKSTGTLQEPKWVRGKSRSGDVRVQVLDAALGGPMRETRGCAMLAHLGCSVVFMPLLEVWLPFGDRISIRHRNGTLILRDLRDADEFLEAVFKEVRSRGIRGVFPAGTRPD